jgi:hypothetical protein
LDDGDLVMTVSRDFASLKFLPATLTEWTQFLSGVVGAPANPVVFYLQQDAAGSTAVDVTGTQNLTVTGAAAQTAVTGWTRTAWNFADASTNVESSTTGPIGDPYTASHLLFAMIAITGTPSANHDVMGFGGSTAYRGVQVTTANKLAFFDLQTSVTTSGTASYGTTVHPVLLQYDRTNSIARIVTDLETITAPYNASSTTNLLFTLGTAATTSAAFEVLYTAAWRGASAEMSAATLAGLLGRITTGYVASNALTPASPSVAAGSTVQLTATATMGDASTANVSSLATWASGTPAKATVNTTGLVTGVSAGTSSITAAFGGATSPGDVVTVTSGTSFPFGIKPGLAGGIAAGIKVGT